MSTSTARGRERKIDDPQAIGRSCGELTTRFHAATDISQAPALLEGFSPKRVIADRAYDADSFIGKVWAFGAEAVIPTRHNRVEQREYDRHWYKNRNLAERFFNRIKLFRRTARHYEKLDRNFMAMIDIACIFVWLL